MNVPDLLPLPKEVEARAWQHWAGSPICAAMHNELVRQIQLDRDRLEAAEPDAIQTFQIRIRLCRDLITFLHKHDPKPKP